MNKNKGRDDEINKAILEWLISKNFSNSIDQFLIESGLKKEDSTKGNSLEKRWGTILTLQKKVSDLETQIKNLKEDLERAGSDGLSNGVTSKKENETMVSNKKINISKIIFRVYQESHPKVP